MKPTRSFVSILFIVAVLTLSRPQALLAQQEPACQQNYTVQAGDWLSKIAGKYYGDIFAYDLLVTAANMNSDDMYTNIENPDLIEPGWVICIVSNETLTMPADGESTAQPEPESDLYAVLESREHTPDPDLIDKVWAWERRDPNGNPIEEIIVPDPENYLLSFSADGTFVTKINCRNALGEYASSSPAETVNSIFMVAGPTTMIFCGEDSLDVQMSQMFGPAQNYQFEEGGAVLKFIWVAAGPIDYYRLRDDIEPLTAQ